MFVHYHNSDDMELFLPTSPYDGRFVLFAKTLASNVTIYGNGKDIINKGDASVPSFDAAWAHGFVFDGEADAWMRVFNVS